MAFDRLQWFRIFVFVGQNRMAKYQIAALIVDFDVRRRIIPDDQILVKFDSSKHRH